jgi:hypothetical protein
MIDTQILRCDGNTACACTILDLYGIRAVANTGLLAATIQTQDRNLHVLFLGLRRYDTH